MRIAFDVGPVRRDRAGVGIYVASLAGALSERLGPDELAFIGRRDDARGLPEGYRMTTRPERWPYPMWVSLTAARDAKLVGASVVHYTDGIVPAVRHGRTVVTVLDLSMVRHWRSHRIARYPRIPLVLAAPHLADVVVVPSRATADEVMKLAGVAASKIAVIPLAARPDVGPTDAETTAAVLSRYDLATRPYIVALGTIEPRKNHVRLVRAFEELVAGRRIDTGVILAIAGQPGWEYEPVMAAIERSAVRERIRVLGYVSDADLSALLTGAAAAAYVSVYEGFGLPVLEAMACGTPVLTSSVSSLPEVAGDAAVLVDPLDVSAIARGLVTLMRESEVERSQRAAAGLARASGFTWRHTAEQTMAVYGSLR